MDAVCISYIIYHISCMTVDWELGSGIGLSSRVQNHALILDLSARCGAESQALTVVTSRVWPCGGHACLSPFTFHLSTFPPFTFHLSLILITTAAALLDLATASENLEIVPLCLRSKRDVCPFGHTKTKRHVRPQTLLLRSTINQTLIRSPSMSHDPIIDHVRFPTLTRWMRHQERGPPSCKDSFDNIHCGLRCPRPW